MVNKARGCRKIVGKLVIAGSFLLAAGLFGNPASAMVTGKCDDCHTMHASQGGVENTEVHVDVSISAPTFAAWNPLAGPGPALEGGDVPVTLQSRLLRTNCIGCHANSTDAQTIVTTAGGIKVPIVYNTTGYPAQALAGGNFWGVADAGGNDDSRGHNVGGISGQDGALARAPGGSSCADAGGCHDNLAGPPRPFAYDGLLYSNVSRDINGCEGCHNKVAHHNPADSTYRYLGGHAYFGTHDIVDGGGLPVTPNTNNLFEDPNWEQSPGPLVHNFYKRQANSAEMDSIGRFCAGCHGAFHAPGATVAEPFTEFGEINGGDPNTDNLIVANSAPVNPWMRHPTNVNLPIGDLLTEYNQLDGLAYDPLVPVAQDPGVWVDRDTIQFGDQVMCLSCHRAHASDQPDALRFEYSAATMSAHTTAGRTNGCFSCHRSKDDP